MKKNRIIAIFTTLAVVLALATCYVVYSYLEPKRQTVYVFNDNYARGTQITDDILTPIKVDGKIMVANSESNIDDQFVTPEKYAEIRKGQYLRMDVSEGMPLTPAMTSGNDSSVVKNMQSSSVAITIAVNGITGVTNELTPESRVNVYCAIEDSVQLILQNMKVLSVFYSDGSINAVSLETTIGESLKLVYAENFGTIYLGLIDGTGYQAEENEGNLFFAMNEAAVSDTDYQSSSYDDYMGMLDSELNEAMDASDEDEIESEEADTEANAGSEDVQEPDEPAQTDEAVPEDSSVIDITEETGIPEEPGFEDEQGTVMPDVG